MTLAFYKVDNSKNYDRHTFDLMQRSGAAWEIKNMLAELSDEELRMYDMDNEYERIFFQDDYNDEELDNGWWCIVIND